MGIQIKTTKGILEGMELGGYTVFKGVPYAKPPVGELRWRAPEELKAWEGVKKADCFGNIGMQHLPTGKEPWGAGYYKEFYSDPAYIPPMSEDCLYLNIWMPDPGEECLEERKLPVAFWIHGGGFAGGYSSEVEFDGEAYCKKGVILVTVEYRLNVFGFLAHPWLTEEDPHKTSGNYGILDQIAALKWVKENIGAFGGDPDNITVFGQSAGSMSTQILASSPLTKGMFAKAILQSGLSCEKEVMAAVTLKEAEEYGKMFTEDLGVRSLEELRALPADKVMEAADRWNARLRALGKGLLPVPNGDGYLLKNTLNEIWREGRMHPIPYICGVVNNDLESTPEEVEEKRPGVLMDQCRQWSGKCREIYGRPAYLYYFTHELPGDAWGITAFHSGELWYTMGTYGRCWRPMEEEDAGLSEEIVSCWTDFMKTGSPDPKGKMGWHPYIEEDPFIKIFS